MKTFYIETGNKSLYWNMAIIDVMVSQLTGKCSFVELSIFATYSKFFSNQEKSSVDKVHYRVCRCFEGG
jgi:hypothetical protein